MPAVWMRNMDEGRGKDTRMDSLCPELTGDLGERLGIWIQYSNSIVQRAILKTLLIPLLMSCKLLRRFAFRVEIILRFVHEHG